jgi:hypothetical protein
MNFNIISNNNIMKLGSITNNCNICYSEYNSINYRYLCKTCKNFCCIDCFKKNISNNKLNCNYCEQKYSDISIFKHCLKIYLLQWIKKLNKNVKKIKKINKDNYCINNRNITKKRKFKNLYSKDNKEYSCPRCSINSNSVKNHNNRKKNQKIYCMHCLLIFDNKYKKIVKHFRNYHKPNPLLKYLCSNIYNKYIMVSYTDINNMKKTINKNMSVYVRYHISILYNLYEDIKSHFYQNCCELNFYNTINKNLILDYSKKKITKHKFYRDSYISFKIYVYLNNKIKILFHFRKTLYNNINIMLNILNNEKIDHHHFLKIKKTILTNIQIFNIKNIELSDIFF